MSTSPTHFLSEITSNQIIPLGKLAYFRERFRDRLYELVVSEFLKRERNGEITKADLARRIRRKPEQISRWLGAPGNWTLETVSDLLLAISKSELNFSLAPLEGRRPTNFHGAEWINATNSDSTLQPDPATKAASENTRGGATNISPGKPIEYKVGA